MRWRSPARRPRFVWFALAGGAWVLFVYLTWVWSYFNRPIIAVRPPMTFEYRSGAWLVGGVDPKGAAAGKLRRGDRLVAVDGDRRAQRIGPLSIHFLAPGSSVELGILRDGAELNVGLTIDTVPSRSEIGRFVSFMLVSLAFVVMAMLMGLVKPEDPLTRLGCVAGLVMAWRLFDYGMSPLRLGATGLAGVLRDLSPIEFPAVALGYHFLYRMSGVRARSVWSILLALLYVVCGTISLFELATGSILVQGRERAFALLYQYPVHLVRATLVPALQPDLFGPLAACAVLLRGYMLHHEPGYRRRLRWVVMGVVAGLAPLVAMNAAFLLGLRFPLNTAPINGFLVLIPMSLAYAVGKHQVMGLRVVIRQGLKYLLARNVLTATLLLPIAGLVLPFLRHPDLSVAAITQQNPVYLNLLLVAALSAGLRYRRPMQTWLDRRFFREAYHQEEILRALIGRVTETHSLAEISRLVGDQVDAALHPRCIQVYYREKASSGLTLGHSSSGTHGLPLPDDPRLIAVLEKTRSAIEYPSAEFDAGREWLDGVDARLIVPITGSRPQLAGVLLLGEKKSEEPYSPADKSLLQALAGQMAMVCENVWLQDRVEEEGRIRHDVLARFDQGDVNLVRECPRCGACYDRMAVTCSADGTELTLTLPVERVIEGRYRLESRIGRGGMGTVYAATDLRLNRQVAVKILAGSLFDNRAALRRFEREARATARLVHPNIVAIHDFGTVGSACAYLVMELVPGCSWRTELEGRRILKPETAALWFDQLLNGLEAAHAASIVHRDLKPDNVLVNRDHVKILDFGLAKMREVEDAGTRSVTLPGTVLGTLGYMAPEQLMGRESDERTDLFSAGVMAVEALTGGRLFRGRDYGVVLASILHADPHLPGGGPAIEHLTAVLRKSLAPSPEMRYQTAAEMRRDLVPALAACPPLGPTGPPDPGQDDTRSMGAEL